MSKNCKNDSIVSVEMGKVGVMAAYSDPLCVCVVHYIYRVSQEESARILESVPYVKLYRYNPKHLCLKLNVYGDNGQRILKL